MSQGKATGVVNHTTTSAYRMSDAQLRERANEAALRYERRYGYRFAKRTFDLIVSLLGMVLLCWLFLIIAIAVKVTSPGPIIFRQMRLGRRKRPFVMYKFRTMYTDVPSNLPTSEVNERQSYLTPVGAFLRRHSLDELPQLLNVFKGDMALVGPRPVILDERVQNAERSKLGVHAIRPGITGWAQVNGRDRVDIMRKARLDAEYLVSMSARNDLRILRMTVGVVLMGTGFGDAIEMKQADAAGTGYDYIRFDQPELGDELMPSAKSRPRTSTKRSRR